MSIEEQASDVKPLVMRRETPLSGEKDRMFGLYDWSRWPWKTEPTPNERAAHVLIGTVAVRTYADGRFRYIELWHKRQHRSARGNTVLSWIHPCIKKSRRIEDLPRFTQELYMWGLLIGPQEE